MVLFKMHWRALQILKRTTIDDGLILMADKTNVGIQNTRDCNPFNWRALRSLKRTKIMLGLVMGQSETMMNENEGVTKKNPPLAQELVLQQTGGSLREY